MPLIPPPVVLAELEAVTRDYARFAGEAAGWSAILGGGLALASLVIGASFDSSPAVRGVMVAIPFLWLLFKQLAVSHYQRSGRVQPCADPVAGRMRRRLLAGVAAICVLIVAGRLASIGSARGADTAIYLAGVLAIPVIAWRFLRTPLDLAVGTFLLCQAVLASSDPVFAHPDVVWVFAPAAILMIVQGVRDHLRFRILCGRMAALRGDIRAAA